MNINLTYAATDKEEFRELVEWLDGRKTPATIAVSPSPSKGPNETEYNRVFGKNLRVTAEDKAKGLSREEIAQSRLAELTASGGATPEAGTVEPEEETSPPDDNSDVF